MPVYALVRRWLLPVLPEDPRRRRRRAYTTGGLLPADARTDAAPDPARTTARPPITPQLALRVAGAGRRRLRAVRDHLLPPVVPAGARRRPVPAAGARQPRARPSASRRRAARSSTPTATCSSRTAADRRADRSRRAARRRARRDRDLGPALSPRARSRPKGQKGPRPPLPSRRGALAGALQAPRQGRSSMSPKTIKERVVAGILQVPYANVPDQGRRRRPAAQLPRRAPRRVPRHRRRAQVPAPQYPYRSLAAQLVGIDRRDRRRRAQAQSRFKGVTPGTTIGQSGLEHAYDQYLRGIDGSLHIEVNAAGERRRASHGPHSPSRAASCKLTLRPRTSSRRGRSTSTSDRPGHGLPGALRRARPARRRVLAMGSLPDASTRAILSGPFCQPPPPTTPSSATAAASPLFNRADQSAYPTGSTFKPITALAALERGRDARRATSIDDTGCIKIGAREDIDKSCNAGKQGARAGQHGRARCESPRTSTSTRWASS